MQIKREGCYFCYSYIIDCAFKMTYGVLWHTGTSFLSNECQKNWIVEALLLLWCMVIVVNPTYSVGTNLNHFRFVFFVFFSLFFTMALRTTGALCSITMISERTSLKGTFACVRGASGMHLSWIQGMKWLTWRLSGSQMIWGRSNCQNNIYSTLMSIRQIF